MKSALEILLTEYGGAVLLTLAGALFASLGDMNFAEAVAIFVWIFAAMSVATRNHIN